jgi:hypothetical protein
LKKNYVLSCKSSSYGLMVKYFKTVLYVFITLLPLSFSGVVLKLAVKQILNLTKITYFSIM